ncbi:MAG TPA: hypothetical protein VII61_06865 [Ktedonobacteraceae bacterium]|jgi:hypothetical protein
MSTALEEMHNIAPHIRVGRARAGVLMLILSDSLSVVALLAAGGYLSALNTENQFKLAADHAPAFLPGLLVAIGLVLSGIAYFWWAQRAQKNIESVQPIIFILAWVFMVAALVGQIWIGATLGYAAPFHAYVSLIMFLTWYSAVHLLLAVIIGLLLLGRVLRGRLAGHSYIIGVTGYWWYYTVVSALLMWLFASFFS